MRFLDVFSGAGGLSLGFTQAGWGCVGSIDNWSDAAKTYKHNFVDHPMFESDIASLRTNAIDFENGADWIIGGPPCQGFSTVGKRERSDPRNKMVWHFARLVRELEPRGFLIENVVGLRDMDFVTHVRQIFEGLGYTVDVDVLRAASYGVPQLRHRIFFVGNREGLHFVFPPAALKPVDYVTVWDAIGDLPELAPGEKASRYRKQPATNYQRAMREGSIVLQGHEASSHPERLVRAISFIPDGGNRQHIPARWQPKSGFHNSYSRLYSKAPAVAVTQNMGKPSGTRCIHPFQDRGLTAREGARLQGFPDTFHFLGGITSQRLQIANAVSPILACHLAHALANPGNWRRDPQVEPLLLDFLAVS